MTTPKLPDDTLSVEDETDGTSGQSSPALFVAFCCDDVLAVPRRFDLTDVESVLLGRGDRTPHLEDGVLSVSFRDSLMSSSHARLRRNHGKGFVIDDLRSKNGVMVNGVRVEHAELSDGDRLELGGTFFIFHDGAPSADDTPRAVLGLETLLPSLARELDAARDVARSSVPILVLGETGTGKEVVARAVHTESRRTGPLVPVNCAALPAALVESELFGNKKGAFSGADTDRTGLIPAAHKGTLFLDEIGELPLPAQAALLRVLQDGAVTPLGGTKPIACDVRVVSATNCDLPALVESGQFRADLFARISGFKLRLRPLRERREDLGLLIASLVRRLAPERAASLSFSRTAARRLFEHDWPYNVRELEKALASAFALSTDRIERQHLQLSTDLPNKQSSPSVARPAPVPRSPEHDERRKQLGELLERHGGNVSAVAREMGKARVQIRRWMRMYRLTGKR